MKACKKCGNKKSLEEFAKDCTKKDGLRTTCRECVSTYNKTRYSGRTTTPVKEVVCTQCKTLKSSDQFTLNKSNKSGLQSACKACVNKNVKIYKKNNPQIFVQKNQEWYQNHVEQKRAYNARYRKNNPKRISHYNGARRARKKGALGEHTIQEWEALKKEFDFRCLCCKKQEPFSDQKFIWLTKDHIVPLKNKGTNYISNIQPLCRRCNSKKNDKTIDFRIQADFGAEKIE